MRRALAVSFLLGCSSPTPTPSPPQPPAAVDAPGVAVAIDTTVAGSDAGPPKSLPGDPPEPVAPQIECAFNRSVFCIAGTPTRVALQPSPFSQCARTQPARQQSVYKLDAQFSAAETRKGRTTQADACCYVDFSTMACD